MNAVLTTAIAGMARSTRAIEVAATNIANVNTGGYRARRYDPASDTILLRNPCVADQSLAGDEPPASDVDLATEFVEIRWQEVGYRANALVIRVADRLMGELLDTLG